MDGQEHGCIAHPKISPGGFALGALSNPVGTRFLAQSNFRVLVLSCTHSYAAAPVCSGRNFTFFSELAVVYGDGVVASGSKPEPFFFDPT